MSWSVNRVGKASAVAEKLVADFANQKCAEPEETIKNGVASCIATALAAFPPNMAVAVRANGSQYAPDSTKPDEKQNNLSVTLEPLPGFVA